ncbi:MAG: MFS transporter [Actinomycetota bacterium]|nr:MFS transporter [Actinomycetota bacterium]
MGVTALRPLLTVIAVATVLRPSVVVVGPLLPRLTLDLGLGAAGAAVLTALPVVSFGLGAFIGPTLSRRLDLNGGLAAAMVVVVVGGVVRVLGGTALLFAGTLAVGLALAVGNVLLPAVVRRDFAGRIGPVTGAYTSTLALTSAIAALTAVPLADATAYGWRLPLALWGLLGLAALWPLAHSRSHGRAGRRPRGDELSRPAAPAAPGGPPGPLRLLRLPATRWLTAFMGLQSIGFYTMVAWLPTLLQSHGIAPAASGALLSLATLLGIPAGLLMPVLAARMRAQGALAATATAVTAVGWLGLLAAPATGAVLWAALLGLGTGATFPVALVLIGLRSRDPATTPQLSAAVQGTGYLIAAGGPLAFGLLHQLTGSWEVPLLVLLGLDGLQTLSGWHAGRAGGV